MKMQKVEVEIPIFDGWEFYKLAKINDLAVYEIDLAVLCDQMLISADFIHSKNIEVAIYKKKKPRKIIYQEVREDYLKRGDFYRDEDGDVNMWISDMPSCEKHPILEKIRDEFEVNNE